MKKKIKIILLLFLMYLILSFLNGDFKRNIKSIPCDHVIYNYQIPEEIISMIKVKENKKKEEEQRKIAEEKAKLEQERIQAEQEKIRIENERIAEEQKIKQNKIQIASRSSEDRTNEGYIKFIATGYCACVKCCGNSNGITAMGTKAKAGRTIAMPKGYDFGTKIEIKNLGTYIVEDRGGAIKNNKLDIYFNTHQEALNWGKRTVWIKVVE